jgi:hypothetical protein
MGDKSDLTERDNRKRQCSASNSQGHALPLDTKIRQRRNNEMIERAGLGESVLL